MQHITKYTRTNTLIPTYYGCVSTVHEEFECGTYSKLNKKFTIDKWCAPCAEKKGV